MRHGFGRADLTQRLGGRTNDVTAFIPQSLAERLDSPLVPNQTENINRELADIDVLIVEIGSISAGTASPPMRTRISDARLRVPISGGRETDRAIPTRSPP